jgi:hypothetical protein
VLAKYTTTTSLGNSSITDNGDLVSSASPLYIGGALTVTGTTTLNTSLSGALFATAGAVSNVSNNTSSYFVLGDGTTVSTSSYLLSSLLGTVNGVCQLDASGKVPYNELPAVLSGAVHYAGTWNASTNAPTLPDATTVNGSYYIVSTAGTYNNIYYNVGDSAISNGVQWEKIDNNNAVTSVFGRTGTIAAQASDYSSYYVSSAGWTANGILHADHYGTLTNDSVLTYDAVNSILAFAGTTNLTGTTTNIGTLALQGNDADTGNVLTYANTSSDHGINISSSGSSGDALVVTTTGTASTGILVYQRGTSTNNQGINITSTASGTCMRIDAGETGATGIGLQIFGNSTSNALYVNGKITFVGMTGSGSAGHLAISTSGLLSVDTSTYITGNQTITLTGAVAGSGTTSIVTTYNTVPATSGGTGQTSYTIGDLLYASSTTALSKLADVATGSALISGGVGVAPSWGKIALARGVAVSGTLPYGNGGTGLSAPGDTAGNLRWNGSDYTIDATAYLTASGSITGNAATATTLATARTIAASGDATWSVSFDGSVNVSSALTLATVNTNVGSFGSGTMVPVVTVNGKGLVTSVSTATITASGLGALTTVTGDTTSRIANTVYAAPNGSAGTATFRALVTSDLPVVDYLHGGTGKSTAWTAYGLVCASSTTVLTNLGAGTSGQLLVSAGSSAVPTWSSVSTVMSSYATAASLSNYLPLAGGTLTGTAFYSNGTYISASLGDNALSVRYASGAAFAQWYSPTTFVMGLKSSDGTATSLVISGGLTVQGFTSSGFVKASSSGVLSVDATTYLTSSTGVSSITGTANQVIASASVGAVTLSLPQSIATNSSPTFAAITAGQAAMTTWAGASNFAWFGHNSQNNTTNGNSGYLQLSDGSPFVCAPTGKSVAFQVGGSGVMVLNATTATLYTALSGTSATFSGNVTCTGSATTWSASTGQMTLGSTNQSGLLTFARGSTGTVAACIGYQSASTASDFWIRSYGANGTITFGTGSGTALTIDSSASVTVTNSLYLNKVINCASVTVTDIIPSGTNNNVMYIVSGSITLSNAAVSGSMYNICASANNVSVIIPTTISLGIGGLFKSGTTATLSIGLHQLYCANSTTWYAY